MKLISLIIIMLPLWSYSFNDSTLTGNLRYDFMKSYFPTKEIKISNNSPNLSGGLAGVGIAILGFGMFSAFKNPTDDHSFMFIAGGVFGVGALIAASAGK